MRHPDHLRDANQQQVKTPLSRSPELTAAASVRVRSFAVLMNNRDGGQRPGWIADICADQQ